MTLHDCLKQANCLGVLTDIQCYCTCIANLMTPFQDNADLYDSLSKISDELAEIIYYLKYPLV